MHKHRDKTAIYFSLGKLWANSYSDDNGWNIICLLSTYQWSVVGPGAWKGFLDLDHENWGGPHTIKEVERPLSAWYCTGFGSQNSVVWQLCLGSTQYFHEPQFPHLWKEQVPFSQGCCGMNTRFKRALETVRCRCKQQLEKSCGASAHMRIITMDLIVLSFTKRSVER